MTKLARFALMLVLLTGIASAATTDLTTNAPSTNAPATAAPKVRQFRVLDADNHNILLNKPHMISVLVGTNEDSQDAARQAGKAMYPFQGRPDFQLIVVVDLRDSIANWVPSVVTARMRSSLDVEAIELKPYFLKNGSKANPRGNTFVVPDFTGTVCPQLGWTKSSGDDLRVIIFGIDGREVERIDKVDDMAKFQADVKAAIQIQVDAEQARFNAAAKTPGSKLLQPVYQHPPLYPFTPYQNKKDE